jgi:glycosyltransferase involved in cell wall biosynthesis
VSISVLLLTLDEEGNLPRCLDALSWCDDIVVLDSFSTDGTVAVAEQRGCRVFQRRFDSFAGQRNYALDSIPFRYEWVLHLDADEVLTPELVDELLAMAAESRKDAWRIPSKLMFMGRWLRHSGMYPTYQVRFGHRDRFRFIQVGHGQREDIAADRVGTCRAPYLHYNFSKGLEEWLHKHVRYAIAEAASEIRRAKTPIIGGVFRDKVSRRRALKNIAANLPFRPLLRFIYMYLFCLGFLDGRAGLIYCRLLMHYESSIALIRDVQNNSDNKQQL